MLNTICLVWFMLALCLAALANGGDMSIGILVGIVYAIIVSPILFIVWLMNRASRGKE